MKVVKEAGYAVIVCHAVVQEDLVKHVTMMKLLNEPISKGLVRAIITIRFSNENLGPRLMLYGFSEVHQDQSVNEKNLAFKIERYVRTLTAHRSRYGASKPVQKSQQQQQQPSSINPGPASGSAGDSGAKNAANSQAGSSNGPLRPGGLSFGRNDDAAAKSGSKREEKPAPQAAPVRSRVGEVVMGPACALQSDCWLLQKRKPRRISGRWMLKLKGPGPSAGRWHEGERDPQGNRQWIWVPNPAQAVDGKDPFIKDPGSWIFRGERCPECHDDLWWFVDSEPMLGFFSEGAPRAFKFAIGDGGALEVSQDSQTAVSYLPLIEATLSKVVTKAKKTQKAQGGSANEPIAQQDLEEAGDSDSSELRGGTDVPIAFGDPLKILSDCWLVGEIQAVRVSDRVNFRIKGPSPLTGGWSKRRADDEDATQSIWEWRPENPASDEFIKEKGVWLFKGFDPRFSRGIWSFAGHKPELTFFMDGGGAHVKVRLSEKGTLQVATDSEAALAMAKTIEASMRAAAAGGDEDDGDEPGDYGTFKSEGEAGREYSGKLGSSSSEAERGVNAVKISADAPREGYGGKLGPDGEMQGGVNAVKIDSDPESAGFDYRGERDGGGQSWGSSSRDPAGAGGSSGRAGQAGGSYSADTTEGAGGPDSARQSALKAGVKAVSWSSDPATPGTEESRQRPDFPPGSGGPKETAARPTPGKVSWSSEPGTPGGGSGFTAEETISPEDARDKSGQGAARGSVPGAIATATNAGTASAAGSGAGGQGQAGVNPLAAAAASAVAAAAGISSPVKATASWSAEPGMAPGANGASASAVPGATEAGKSGSPARASWSAAAAAAAKAEPPFPSIKPLAMAFLMSELMCKQGLTAKQVAEKFCGYLAKSCGPRLNMELWYVVGDRMYCAATSDGMQGVHGTRAHGIKDPVKQISSTLVAGSVFGHSGDHLGCLIFSGENAKKIPASYITAVASMTVGILQTFIAECQGAPSGGAGKNASTSGAVPTGG